MENNQKRETKVLFSYNLYPDVKFETYEPGEKIILLLRAHPFTQIPWIITSILIYILILILNMFIANFFSGGQILIFNIFGVMFLLSYIWFSFISWYFNVGIITNKRIIDIDFYVVLYKEITVARLDKVEDITLKSGGYFESFLDFGTVFIQTAGTEANIEFANIPKPSLVVQLINNILNKRHGH